MSNDDTLFIFVILIDPVVSRKSGFLSDLFWFTICSFTSGIVSNDDTLFISIDPVDFNESWVLIAHDFLWDAIDLLFLPVNLWQISHFRSSVLVVANLADRYFCNDGNSISKICWISLLLVSLI